MKKVLVALLCGVLVLGLVACTAQPGSTEPGEPNTEQTEEPTSTPDETKEPEGQPGESTESEKPDKIVSDEPLELPSYCTDAFATALIDYVNDLGGYEHQNFMISPTSLRAALCLAMSGAEGNTKKELLEAADFETQEDAESWYAMLLQAQDDFAEATEHLDGDSSFALANAIWANKTLGMVFDEEYVKYVQEHYKAEARTSPAGTITDDINLWCNEKTNGMIQYIVDNVDDAPNVLLNALYLKSAWVEAFDEGETEERFFTTYDEQGIKMMFMGKTEDMLYYHDDDTTIAVLQLWGDKQFVVVMGDRSNLSEKLEKLESTKVHFMMPKFEMESKFDAIVLMNFLQLRGVNDAMNWQTANFSGMSKDMALYLYDIIQKDKITVDEHGLEAAAVTAIVMKNASLPMEEVEPVEFIADHPFSYYIYSGLGTTHEEMLFYGQMVDKLAE